MGRDHSVAPRAMAGVGSPLHVHPVNDPLPIDRHGNGAPYAYIVEGRHIGAQVDD